MDVKTFPVNLLTTSGLSILLHGVISLLDATSYDKLTNELICPLNIKLYYMFQLINLMQQSFLLLNLNRFIQEIHLSSIR